MGKLSESIIELLQLLDKNAEMSLNEIAKNLDVRRESVSRELKELIESNKILTSKKREGRKFVTYISLIPQVDRVTVNPLPDKKDHSESEKKIHCDQVEDIEELLKEMSYTQVSMKKYVMYFLDTKGVIPATETLKVLFPQLTDSEIAIVVKYYKEQGHPQLQFRGDNRNANQLIDEGLGNV